MSVSYQKKFDDLLRSKHDNMKNVETFPILDEKMKNSIYHQIFGYDFLNSHMKFLKLRGNFLLFINFYLPVLMSFIIS